MDAKLKHILCIDDESDILEVAKMALEIVAGFMVTTCASAKEGIPQVEALKPDIILLDVMMPAMDGPSALKILQSIPTVASIPVIFMTAKVQPSQIEHYLTLGAIGVIPKPFDPMTLPLQVQTLWQAFHEQV